MASIFVTNTLTRQKEQLATGDPGKINMYVCGVTPYDYSHLGHARPAVVFDVFRRYLRLKGYQVKLVQNFTDVDDKIIARANESGCEPLALSQEYSQEYLASIDALGVERADVYPKVSEHMDDIIAMVSKLIDKGVAYAVDGDVFFSVKDFPEYGKLSNQRLDDLEAGKRLDIDERKRSPLDFALWKAAKPGEPAWESPWGLGRPGWHIECSAMSLKYLGNHLDIHGGGVDIVFPHHENEIAQSEAFTGEAPFVRYWMHNGLVNVDGEKMSKSLGNFVSIQEAVAEYPAQLLRFFILSHHYRTPVDFASPRLAAAQKAWERLNRLVWDLNKAGVKPDWPGLAEVWKEPAADSAGLVGEVDQAACRLDAFLADDFNTPGAFGVLFELVSKVRVAFDHNVNDSGVARALGFFQEVTGELLGTLSEEKQPLDHDLNRGLMELLLKLRTEARAKKDWATADHIRDALTDLGITLEDTPTGTRWSL